MMQPSVEHMLKGIAVLLKGLHACSWDKEERHEDKYGETAEKINQKYLRRH